MESGVVVAVAGLLVVGVLAEWAGWRLKLPAIVFLLAAGLLAGPITGLLNPDELFGDLLFPFVNLAVAVILFEGALGLGVPRVRHAGRTVWLLLTVGATVTVVLTAVAARLLLDVGWPLAWLLGAVLVVTGPTVIGPLVRSIGLRGRLSAILESEGTLIDPIGAILAVLVFQGFFEGADGGSLPIELLLTLLGGAVVGLAAAWLLTAGLGRFILPDELHNLATLALVILAFAVADAFQKEAGLVAVTVMGLTLASQRRAQVHHVLEFNETLRTLFISGLFLVLGARIEWETLQAVEWRNLVFLVALVVIVRPLAVALSTIRSGLTRAERFFIAATAPRGIVAAAIAATFSLRLSEVGALDSQVLVSASFTVIAGTVLLSGLGSRPLARRLGLIDESQRPVVILGTNTVAVAFAEALDSAGISTRLMSLDRREVAHARLLGMSARHGSILDEGFWDEVQQSAASTFVALTSSDEVNALACRQVAPLVGRRNVFRVASARPEHAEVQKSASTPGRLLIDEAATFETLGQHLEQGWRFRSTILTEVFDESEYVESLPDGSMLVGVINPEGVDLATRGQGLRIRTGDRVIALVPVDEP